MRMFLWGVALFVICFVFSSGAVAASACTQSVASGGSIQAALGVAVPGDTICISPGTYHEIISVTRSGTTTQPIIIQALDPNNRPTIDGQYTLPAGSPGNFNQPSYANYPCLEYAADPNAHDGPGPKQNCFSWDPLITIKASFIIWDGINITRSRGRGVVIGTIGSSIPSYTDYTNVVFKNSEISNIRENGIFNGHVSNVTLDHLILHDIADFATYSRTSSTGPNWPGGIYQDYAQNVVITNSVVYHVWGEAVGTDEFNNSKNVTIKGNVIYDNFAVGLYVQNVDTANIQNNIIFSTSDLKYFRGGLPSRCVAFTSETGKTFGNILFANNIVANCKTLIDFEQFASGSSYHDFKLYNNTLINPYGSGIVMQSGMTTLTGFSFVNNLIHGPMGSFSPATGMTVHHNIWSTMPGANLSGTGDVVTDTPSMANPAYRPSSGMFDISAIKLLVGSKAIDAGVALVEVANDFFGGIRPAGATWDIGAHEFGASVSPTASPASPTAVGPSPTAAVSCALKQRGDADCDGQIRLGDFNIWRLEFYGELKTLSADFNGDGKVSLADFEIWRRTFTAPVLTPRPT